MAGNRTARRVVGDIPSACGGYAEAVAVAADGLIEVPDGLSLADAG